MAKRRVKARQRPDWVPRPLPGNEDVFAAFYIVQNCREYTFGGVAGFNWRDVEVKLKCASLWNEDVMRKLSSIEIYLSHEEQQVRDGEEELRQKKLEEKKKKKVR